MSLVHILHCTCLSAVASAWRCASVSSLTTPRAFSSVWRAGTCSGHRPPARPSSPLTPQPKWRCSRWTPAASPRSSPQHRRSNSGERTDESVKYSQLCCTQLCLCYNRDFKPEAFKFLEIHLLLPTEPIKKSTHTLSQLFI